VFHRSGLSSPRQNNKKQSLIHRFPTDKTTRESQKYGTNTEKKAAK
jgi:hypothetical protein